MIEGWLTRSRDSESGKGRGLRLEVEAAKLESAAGVTLNLRRQGKNKAVQRVSNVWRIGNFDRDRC